MTIDNAKQLFVRMLSDLRQGAENSATIYHMLSEHAEHDEVKQALEARAFVSNKVLSTLDECFKMIHEQPTKPSGRLYDIFVEDFRKDLSEIQSPEARHLFIMTKAHQLNNLRIGEYAALIEVADMTGNYGLGVLLASCLADKVAFMERTRHLIRKVVEGRIEMRLAA